MRFKDNGYEMLITELQAHPEFNGEEDLPCDEKICAMGAYLWKQWEDTEHEDGLPPINHNDVDFMLESGEINAVIADRLHKAMDYPPAQAAQLCDCKKAAILRLRTMYGPHNFYTKEEEIRECKAPPKEELLAALEELGSIKSVAQKYNHTQKTIKKYFNLRGINVVKILCDKQKEQDSACHSMRKQGMTARDIAKVVGLGNNNVLLAAKRWQDYLDRRAANGGEEVAYGRFSLSEYLR